MISLRPRLTTTLIAHPHGRSAQQKNQRPE
jgi:hypothetical protein